MWKEKYETLKAEYDTLVEAHDGLAERLRKLESPFRVNLQGEPSGASHLPLRADPDEDTGAAAEGLGPAASVPVSNFDVIYRYIIGRAAREKHDLELLISRPELRVTIEKQIIEANGETLRGALAVLITKKFFDLPQNANTAFNELKRLGRRVAKPGVYRELDKLAELGFVTKEEGGYQAVAGMKVQIIEQKPEKAVAAR